MNQEINRSNPMYLTVSALTKYIKLKLEGDKHLVSVLIKGEISNFKRHSRGHLYFTLKDENAQISAIMFARDAEKLLFSPKEGDHVLITGKISVYEPSGTYNIQVIQMSLDGIGELYLKYEALKKECEAKGYFKMEHKRSIPKYPKIIGVITSPTGAVIQDIINTVNRRFPLVEIHLYPTLVQGPGSAESIVNQIRLANQKGTADVLIVGRGGGSIEDLWSFNEMIVIEAIYQSKIPIITAIGHETDFTISDFVSDLRAPTPTAAAELATPNQLDIKTKIKEYQDSLNYRISLIFNNKQTTLTYLDQRLDVLSPTQKLEQLKTDLKRYHTLLLRNMLLYLENQRYEVHIQSEKLKSPQDRISMNFKLLNQAQLSLDKSVHYLLSERYQRFEVLRHQLEALNPLSVMEKGFAVLKKNGKVTTSIHELHLGDDIELTLKDGNAYAQIKEIKVK